jgi:hypothetical protein
MRSDPKLVDLAIELFGREWYCDVDAAELGAHVSECPAASLLPQLVEMIGECCERPVALQALTIKRLIVEQTFHGLGGDHAEGGNSAKAGTRLIERQVTVVVRVLEAVRLDAIAQGKWSTAPVTPQMFG